MEKIYSALSGLNSLDPVALIGTTTKYEFNDIHNWTSHVFIACAREDTELETVQTVMKHLRETINFALPKLPHFLAISICHSTLDPLDYLNISAKLRKTQNMTHHSVFLEGQ